MILPHAAESLHWYWPDGRPAYEVPGAKGQPVNPDIRHARKLGLVPSVTTIMRVMAAPALERWKREQYALAALTLPRLPDETDSAFLKRLDADAQAWTRQRADDGTALHAAIEQEARGEAFDPRFAPHLAKIKEALSKLPVSFVGDFKTKDTLEGKDRARLFYDEHVMQLAAYRHGIIGQTHDEPLVFERAFAHTDGYGGRVDVFRGTPWPDTPLVSIMIAIEPADIEVKVWTNDEARRGLALFQCALQLWKLKNRVTALPAAPTQ